MYWIKEMRNAIAFIEGKLLEEISVDDVAKSAHSSSANFQRIFVVVMGVTVGDYIRSRRLSLAGKELVETNGKALDMAVKYGYDSAASFTKAFTRFHGITPSAAKRQQSRLKYFAPFSINIEITGGLSMKRKLIPNVPEIAYDGNNAAFFITLLKATLQSVGEEHDYAKLTALSGEGNRFCWTGGAWKFGNEVTESINELPFETQHRVLSAIGWNAKYITVQRDKDGHYMNTSRLQIRQDFIDAVNRGFPVIARLDMDDNDMNVFFGYADDGEKIIGYRYNANHMKDTPTVDAAVPVEFENWEDKLHGYILLQNKSEASDERGAALAAFKMISVHARKTDEIRGRKIGFAAWESFLHMLENDDFTALVHQELKERFIIYCDALCQIHARSGAIPYYESLAERFHEWRDELETAIQALKECADYGGFLWSQGFTFDDAGFAKFRAPGARKPLAEAGRRAYQNDIIAVEQFEGILRKEGVYPHNYILKQAEIEPFDGPRCPEMQPLTGSIRACLDYMGENYGFVNAGGSRLDKGTVYVYNLLGEAYTHDATRMYHSNTVKNSLDGMQRLFSVLGYAYEIFTNDPGRSDYRTKEQAKQRIKEHIFIKNRPVVTNGLWEDPMNYAVIGYENDGEVLVGWNYHVFDFSPNPAPKIQRKAEWYNHPVFFILLGEQAERLDEKTLCQRIIREAYHYMTDRKTVDLYDELIRLLSQTEDECIAEVKRTHILLGDAVSPHDQKAVENGDIFVGRMIDPLWCCVAERRYYAAQFFKLAQSFLPEQAELLKEIENSFWVQSDTFGKAYIADVGHEPTDREKFRDINIRKKMAAVVEQAKQEERKSIELIKKTTFWR